MIQWIRRFFTKNKGRGGITSHMTDSSVLVQTSVHNLTIGMYVYELDIPWLESPFPFQGFMIETEKDLQKLRDVCNYVYIDTSKQKKRKTHSRKFDKDIAQQPLVFEKPPERLGSFEKEIDKAKLTFQETGMLVTDFMDKVASGGGVDSKLAKEAVSACVNSILHSPDAFLWLTQLKNKDKYTAQHSLNVCVLSIVLGRHIGLSEKHLNHVGLCGMMHDMGKMLVPLEVLNKPGRLEPDELILMQSHTTLGYELLKSSEGMFFGAVETALTHHERMDGNGYPRRMKSHKLSYYSNIVAIADIYDAITSDRVYQKGRTHYEATKIMLEVSGNHLDSKLVVKFIESLGAYPPGCFVELSNGSVAIVVEENSRFKLRPKVMLVLGEDKNPVDELIVDLAGEGAEGSEVMQTIKTIVSPADYQIDSAKYYQQGIIQKGFAKR